MRGFRPRLPAEAEKFEKAVTANDIAAADVEFPKIENLMRAASPANAWGATLVAYAARYAFRRRSALPLVDLAAARWLDLEPGKIPDEDLPLMLLFAGLIAGIRGQHDDGQVILEQAASSSQACRDTECEAAAKYYRAQLSLFTGNPAAVAVHAHYSAALFEIAGCLQLAADAGILEAEAKLRLGETGGARTALDTVLSIDPLGSDRLEDVYALLARSMPIGATTWEFEVALSYAGGARRWAGALARQLARPFGRGRVMYDRFHQAEFIACDLDVHLQRLFRDRSALAVVFLNKAYVERKWCTVEWRAIRDRLDRGSSDTILLRLDDTRVHGISWKHGFIDLREYGAVKAARLITQRWIRSQLGAFGAVAASRIPPQSARPRSSIFRAG